MNLEARQNQKKTNCRTSLNIFGSIIMDYIIKDGI